MSDAQQTARQAREAALRLAATSGETRDGALLAIAGELFRRREEIFAANERDLERGIREGLAAPLQKRLRFDSKKLGDTLSGIGSLRGLPDPLGRTTLATELAPGLNLYRVTCPIGVVGVIFESRPDALVQIATLCLKSGNAVLLKGGSEARLTNRALFDAITAGAAAADIPNGWAGLLESRAEVADMLKMDEDIDLVITRGSREFVRHIMTESRIPVMGHADGLCHTYIDASADCAMAVRVAVDGKAQYAAVCNATETLLCHKDIATQFLPLMKAAMEEAGVTLRGCPPDAGDHRRRSGNRGGLGYRIPRLYPLGQGGGQPGRGHRAHQPPRLGPHRRHRHQGP
jgi:glutamate-5-semialdehyde dehydrogenase